MTGTDVRIQCGECRGRGSIELLVRRVTCTACKGSGWVSPAVLDARIDSLDLSPGTRNALKKASAVTVRQLVGCTEQTIRSLSGMTDSAIAEIKVALAKLGLRMRAETP